MPDIADQSDLTIEQNDAAALARVPKPPKPRHVAYDAECEECGELIGRRRASLGYDTCIDCANLAEHRGAHFANGRLH